MDIDTFYKLDYLDMAEVLWLLKLTYDFVGISKKDIFNLTTRFKNGFKPQNLKNYMIGINKQGLIKSDEETKWFYENIKRGVDNGNIIQ